MLRKLPILLVSNSAEELIDVAALEYMVSGLEVSLADIASFDSQQTA